MECSLGGAEIFYTTDGSTPTELSTKYTQPIAFAYGTYKAIAKLVSTKSAVYEIEWVDAPMDYMYYYPLTADFNDHKGSNNLINNNCTISSNGCLIDNNSDILTITNGVSMAGGFTISFTYTPTSLGLFVCLFGETGNSQIMRIENYLGNWGSYPYGTTASPILDLTAQKIVITQDGIVRKYYRNGILCLTQNTDIPTLKYIGNFPASGYAALGYWKEIKIYKRVLSIIDINK